MLTVSCAWSSRAVGRPKHETDATRENAADGCWDWRKEQLSDSGWRPAQSWPFIASARVNPPLLFAKNLSFHRTTIQADASCRLLVAAALAVDLSAIELHQLLRGGFASAGSGSRFRDRFCMGLAGASVFAVDHHIAKRLLKFSEVSRPVVAGA